MPATDDGRIHLFAHTHLFRNFGANAYLPSATAASDFARRHDLIGGEWHSGSDQIPPMGMKTLSDGTRLEGVMMKANPNLLMYLYFNGTRAEKAYWSPFFPPSWYLTTEPDHFGVELMNLHSDAIFAAPDTLKGAPARAGFTAHGWNDWSLSTRTGCPGGAQRVAAVSVVVKHSTSAYISIMSSIQSATTSWTLASRESFLRMAHH